MTYTIFPRQRPNGAFEHNLIFDRTPSCNGNALVFECTRWERITKRQDVVGCLDVIYQNKLSTQVIIRETTVCWMVGSISLR